MISMTIPPWLIAIRKAIGKLTDYLIAGRQGGLWDKRPGPDIKPKDGLKR